MPDLITDEYGNYYKPVGAFLVLDDELDIAYLCVEIYGILHKIPYEQFKNFINTNSTED